MGPSFRLDSVSQTYSRKSPRYSGRDKEREKRQRKRDRGRETLPERSFHGDDIRRRQHFQGLLTRFDPSIAEMPSEVSPELLLRHSCLSRLPAFPFILPLSLPVHDIDCQHTIRSIKPLTRIKKTWPRGGGDMVRLKFAVGSGITRFIR